VGYRRGRLSSGKFPPLWSEWNGKYRDCVRDFWRGENQTLGEFAYLGNNNAYCQDNEISWFGWDLVDEDLLDFTRKLIHFRKKHPIFRRRGWFLGEALHGKGIEDICWFTPDVLEMEEEHWGEGFAKSITVFLNGRGIHSADAFGQRITDSDFLILLNAPFEKIVFKPPVFKWKGQWIKVLDTATEGFLKQEMICGPDDEVPVQGRSLVVLKRYEAQNGSA
jgi:isoamylase